MRVIPVIDLKRGSVVRAIGGKRDAYQSVQSVLSSDASPISVATGLVQRLHAREAYVADLDAIAGAEPAWDLYRCIADTGLRLWVDAGVATVERACQLIDHQIHGQPLHRVILGLESVSTPADLAEITVHVDVKRLAFSLDLFDGCPLHGSAAWRGRSAVQTVQSAIEVGIARVIVLDLARVGRGGGTGTQRLCRQLHQAYPSVELFAGGGISGLEQIEGLARAGCDGVLLGSALHDGRLTAKQLRAAGLL
jgi:phosphoribosylformimino-5-aminoimidazole carboxamide ribotide isomerase